jgi:hypothetical protein
VASTILNDILVVFLGPPKTVVFMFRSPPGRESIRVNKGIAPIILDAGTRLAGVVRQISDSTALSAGIEPSIQEGG